MFNAIKSKVLDTVKKINDSYEFKPLLSEIEEAPVSPLGRFTFWTIVSLIIVTALWLFIGKVDIVVNARGIVIPDGEAKIIQPLETGVVKEIDVINSFSLSNSKNLSSTSQILFTVNTGLKDTLEEKVTDTKLAFLK